MANEGTPRRPRHRSSVLEAHQIYLQYHREAQGPDGQNGHDDPGEGGRGHKPVAQFPMFHRVQKTGVIYATSRAASRGFTMGSTEWA